MNALFPSIHLEQTCALLSLTLLHFLWQGLLIAVIALVLAWFFSFAGPRVRYTLHLTALLAMAVAPMATMCVLIASGRGSDSVLMQQSVDQVSALPENATARNAGANSGSPAASATIQAKRIANAHSSNSSAHPRIDPTIAVGSATDPGQPAKWHRYARYIVATYFLGVALMLARVIIGLQNASALRRSAMPIIAPDLIALFQRRAKDLGLAVLPALATSTRIAVPCVIGVLGPIILLPPAILGGLTIQQLEQILTHELAHLRRYDHWFSLLQRLIEASLFFHPAVWVISRRVSAEREMCCDDLAIAGGTSRESYARSLLQVAELCMQEGASPSLAAVGRPSQLRRRITRLLADRSDGEFIPQRRWIAALLVPTLAAVAFSLNLVSHPVTAAAADANALQFRVVDETSGQPLAGAQLKIRVNDARSTATADANGIVPIELPPNTDILDVSATSAHHVPMRVAWNNRVDDIPVKFPSQSYTLKLRPGQTVGGIVQDEQGKAIDGAKVYVSFEMKRELGSPFRGNAFISAWDIPVTAGKDGHWTCDVAPANWESARVRAEHPDFYSPPLGESIKAELSGLRDLKNVSKMVKGVPLSGTVHDSDGKPIAGVQIAYGMEAGSEYPETTSAADGTFRFAHAKRGKTEVMAIASGFAPKVRNITLDGKTGNVDFVLQPSKVHRGQVVDPAGAPIVGARIYAETVDGQEMLGAISVDTDANGRFQLDGDDGPIHVSITKAGFSAADRFVVVSGAENMIHLKLPLRISGKIIDADSGEPIANGRIVQSFAESRGVPVWQTPNVFNAGAYRFTFGRAGAQNRLRFEADGYRPVESPAFKLGDTDVQYDVKMKRDSGLSGVVQDSAGKPVSGAEVYISTASKPGPQLTNGRVDARRAGGAIRTDINGKFNLPVQTDRFAILVVADAGFATLDGETFAKSAAITLRQWASVDGIVKIGSKLASEAEVSGSIPNFDLIIRQQPRIEISIQAKTDANGHFHVDRVAPAKYKIGREVEDDDHNFSSTSEIEIEPKPGEQLAIQIGGTGRPVVGRVILPEPLAASGRWVAPDSDMSTKRPKPPQIKRPDNWADLTADERRAWTTKWHQSDEYKAYQAAMDARAKVYRSYPVVLNRDGTFRVEDVEPGEYEIIIRFAAPGGEEELGGTSAEFTVPDIEGGHSDQPFEIPPIMSHSVKTLPIGNMATTFSVPSLDGKQIKLEDYRGKVVLLDFWATWCGPCVEEMPKLKAIYDEYGKDDRFVMIGLSLDDKQADLQKFVDANQIKWPQALLGAWSKSTVAGDYGVSGIPSIWLIGPDGHVIAKIFSGDDILPQVARVLSTR